VNRTLTGRHELRILLIRMTLRGSHIRECDHRILTVLERDFT
jgi:hypothetical protein